MIQPPEGGIDAVDVVLAVLSGCGVRCLLTHAGFEARLPAGNAAILTQ